LASIYNPLQESRGPCIHDAATTTRQEALCKVLTHVWIQQPSRAFSILAKFFKPLGTYRALNKRDSFVESSYDFYLDRCTGETPRGFGKVGFSRRKAFLCLSLSVFLAFASCASLVRADDDWTMFHHDLQHTGYSTSAAPNTNSTLWNYTTGNIVHSSPAVAEGKVYVGSDDYDVYCLDASTGTKIWNYTTFGKVGGSPAVADGKV
jgi:hypothetical protein